MSADVAPPRGSSADWSCEAHAYRVTALESKVSELDTTVQRQETATQARHMDTLSRLIRIETKLDSWIPEAKERAKQDETRAREVLPRYVWPLVMLVFGAVLSSVLTLLLRR